MQTARLIVAVSGRKDKESKSMQMVKEGILHPKIHIHIMVNDCVQILYQKKFALKKNNNQNNLLIEVSLLRKKLPNFKYFENSLRHICPPIIKKLLAVLLIKSLAQYNSVLFNHHCYIKDTYTSLVYTYSLPHYLIVNLTIPKHHYYLWSTYHVNSVTGNKEITPVTRPYKHSEE